MATSAPARSRDVEHWASTRETYLDNLKVVLVASIIAIHGVLSYSSSVLWTYSDVREATLAPVTEYTLFAVVAPFAFFMIALLFLAAGLLTPGSLARKGSARFARDRVVRLGIPFAVFVLTWPLLVRWMEEAAGMPGTSYGAQLVDEDGHIDAGPLWFVGTLLVFSLAYAAAAAGAGLLRRGHHDRAGAARGPVTLRRLWLLVGLVAVSTYLVRSIHPAGSESTTDLNLWEWPACIALFGLGVVAAGQGWLAQVPDALARGCRSVALVVGPGLVAAFVLGEATGSFDAVVGGWTWQSALFISMEAPLTVFGSVWLLRVAQRRLTHPLPWGPVLTRSAYAAFILQAPVLVALALALRHVPVAAELKAVVVAGGSVAGSFALAWLLVSRLPVLGRAL